MGKLEGGEDLLISAQVQEGKNRERSEDVMDVSPALQHHSITILPEISPWTSGGSAANHISSLWLPFITCSTSTKGEVSRLREDSRLLSSLHSHL